MRHRREPAHPARHASNAARRSRGGRRVAWVALALVLLGLAGGGLALWQQGYRMYVVHTGSMVPRYVPGDLIIDRPASGHYRVGEVITFRHSDLTPDVVTHRIVGFTPQGLIRTKGDANRTPDAWEIRPAQVRGTAPVRVPGFGYLAVYLRQPAGVASLATVVFALVLLWRMFFPVETPQTPPRSATSRYIPAFSGLRTLHGDRSAIAPAER